MTAAEQTALIADLQAAAVLLERISAAYDYHPVNATWSPRSLRYEADYLTKHPAADGDDQ